MVGQELRLVWHSCKLRPRACDGRAEVVQGEAGRRKLALGEDYVDTGYVLVDELGEPVRTDWLRRRAYEPSTASISRGANSAVYRDSDTRTSLPPAS